MPFSQILPPSPSPRVQKAVLYICVSFAVSQAKVQRKSNMKWLPLPTLTLYCHFPYYVWYIAFIFILKCALKKENVTSI